MCILRKRTSAAVLLHIFFEVELGPPDIEKNIQHSLSSVVERLLVSNGLVIWASRGIIDQLKLHGHSKNLQLAANCRVALLGHPKGLTPRLMIIWNVVNTQLHTIMLLTTIQLKLLPSDLHQHC